MANEKNTFQYVLSFSADTSKAKAALQDLNKSLSDLTSGYGIGQKKSSGFDSALKDITKLQGALAAAKTATEDFSLTKFERALKKSGLTIDQVRQSLNKLGHSDDFEKLAAQIGAASSKTQVFDGILHKFFDGLKNTAMWTLQSNAIHALQSALEGAYAYAQKLDKSLTDIAIVSDLNKQQLNDFAKTANQMARELSASTGEVLSGALIYYQAGLSDEEVIKRTETTIKLAQTSGESAEQISSYMTAIWNNFDDGSKSVEYYADVISYLGAVTAASNADIAEGIQSFASTAETVGLSFEYAAGALTVLRDVTQQSASTIGNSLKTIFARLEGLKLGETLEDGVDLNKYSKALASVGVRVLDANGNLRQMDDILDDLADKWDSLSEAEQVALAQTVGGVRQYNNLISLMENYDRFQELVSGSRGSDGYLSRQAEEYAESWEGAQNRVKAGWEEIYAALIDRNFFTKLTGFWADILHIISEIIKGVGGLPGLFAALMSGLTVWKGFATELNQVAQTLLTIRDVLTGVQQANNESLQLQSFLAMGKDKFDEGDNLNFATLGDLVNRRQEALNQKDYAKAAELFAEAQRLVEISTKLRELKDENLALAQQQVEKEKEHAQIEQEIKELEKQQGDEKLGLVDSLSSKNLSLDQKKNLLKQVQANPLSFDINPKSILFSKKDKKGVLSGDIDGLTEADIVAMIDPIKKAIKNYAEKVAKVASSTVASESSEAAVGAQQDISEEMKKQQESSQEINNSLDERKKKLEEIKKEEAEIKAKLDENDKKQRSADQDANLIPRTNQQDSYQWQTAITSATRALSNYAMISNGVKSLSEALFGGQDLSGTQLISALTSTAIGMQQATKSMQELGTILTGTKDMLPAFGGALKGLGTFLSGPFIYYAMAAVAAITLIGFGIKKLKEYDYSISATGQLEKINQQLAEQKQYVAEVTNEYQNVVQTLEKLPNQAKNIEKMTVGTAEWTAAVYEHNNAILELLSNYDLLGQEQYYTKDEHGVLSLTDEGAKAIERSSQDRLNSAVLGQYALQSKAYAKQSDVYEENLRDSLSWAAGQYVTKKTDAGEWEDDVVLNTEWDRLIDGLRNGSFTVEKVNDQFNILSAAGVETNELWNEIINNSGAAKENLNDFINNNGKLSTSAGLLNEQIGNMILDMAGIDLPSTIKETIAEKLGAEYTDAYNTEKSKLDNLDQAGIVKLIQDTKDSTYRDALAKAGYTYNAKDDAFYDSNGDKVESLEKIRMALATEVVKVQIINPGDIKKDLDNSNPGWEDQAAAEQKAKEEAAAETIRTQGAKEDINNNANGFNKKELASIESLVEELKTGELYADKFSKGTLETEGSVKKLAFAMKQADQGIQEWTKSWYDWEDAIKNSERGSFEYIEAMDEIKDSSADLLGITDELSAAGMTLGSTFGEYVEKNLDTVYKAFSGSQEAALEMQKWAAEDMANQLQSAQDLSDSELANVQDSIAAHMDVMAAMLDSGDLKFGRVDDSELLGSLENIINSIATTKDEAEALLAAMGYDAEVEEEHDTVKRVQMRWIPQEFSTDSVPVGINGTDTFSFITSLGELGHWDPVEIEEPKTVTALKIKTADYVGGGNITTSKGGGGTRAPKKTGGGGGGKKQKTKEKDTTRYHEITQRLEQNQHALNMLNAQEDRAYGQKKLDMMDQKLKLLQQQAELYEQLAKEAKNYYDNDRERLHNEYGAAFNPDGTIKDYDSWYGSFVDKYNAGQMSDDEWKKFEDAIKKYEESLKKMNEAEEKLQKNLFEQYDIKLEKVEYKLKTITKLIEMDMEYLDYMINMLDDDGLDTAEAIGYLAREIDDITKKYEANKEALEGIFKNHEGITDEIIADLFSGAITVDEFIEKVGDFTEKEIESLQSIMSSMFQNGQDLKKYIESLYDKLNELSDKFQASIDKAIDKLNHMNNMIEKTRNIIDIMGKDTLGISDELLNRMQRAQIEIGKEHVATLQQELDQYRAWLAEEEALYATMDPDSLEARALRDVIENYKKTIMSLEEEILDTAADTAEKIKQIYRDMIQQAVDEMGKQISGRVGDFEKLLDLYEKQKNLDDRYLDTYEKTYQTNKLLRDIRKSLDDTDNLRTQELLRDLQGEILDMQKEGVQVAEEQLQERRLYYELLLAEAALQEAQDAKNMVRMTRDSEGNWSYTYTADQGKVDDLRQRYDDALHAYEEFNENTLQTMQDTLLQMQEEYSNALAEAQTEDEVRALAEYYEPMIDHQRQMIDYFITRNNELVENFNVNADQVSTKLDDTVYGMVTGFGSMDEAAQAMDEAYDEVKDHVIDYLGQMEKEQQELAATVHVTEPEINADLDKIEQGVADVNKEVDKVSEEFNEEFGDAMGTLADFHARMGPIIDGIIGELGNITSTVGDVITAYSKLSHTPVTAPDLSAPIGAFRALEAAAEAAAAAAKKAANAGSPLDTGSEPVDYGKRAYPQTSYGAWWSGFTEYRTGGYVGHGAKSIIGAATGMYTGAWGEEGKLAVLHEKELVLNKHDTENMLKTVGFVRDLTQMISLNASVAGQGLGNLFLGGVSQGGGFLDQNVTIHAEFPNATNHTEIEEAFNNLIGLASQYAGRKK